MASQVKAGEKATATCVLKEGSQPLVFVWLKDGKDASQLANVKVKSSDDYSVLVINPTDAQYSGNYTCVVKNPSGTDSQTAHIEVEAAPQWKRVPGDTEVGLGATKAFECIALGSPKPRVTWSKRTKSPEGWISLQNIERVALEETTMTLIDIEASDSGTYSCDASNGIGEHIKSTFRVVVHGNVFNEATAQDHDDDQQKHTLTSNFVILPQHASKLTPALTTAKIEITHLLFKVSLNGSTSRERHFTKPT